MYIPLIMWMIFLLQMMFNYDVSSNAFDISRAFEKEYLPLQQVPSDLSQSGMLQWQNG